MKGMADLAPPPCPAQAQQPIPGSPADLMLLPQQKAHRGTHQRVKATAYAGRGFCTRITPQNTEAKMKMMMMMMMMKRHETHEKAHSKFCSICNKRPKAQPVGFLLLGYKAIVISYRAPAAHGDLWIEEHPGSG
jgi:hypothetical protein